MAAAAGPNIDKENIELFVDPNNFKSIPDTIHYFDNDGTFEPQEDLNIEAVIIAGGGAGASGNCSGGGGGGGGIVHIPSVIVNKNQTYTIKVGDGGSGTGSSGNQGENSEAFDHVALGGGGGGNTGQGSPGGSGGGQAYYERFGNDTLQEGLQPAYTADNKPSGSTAIGYGNDGGGASGFKGGGAGASGDNGGAGKTFFGETYSAGGGTASFSTSTVREDAAANTGNGGSGNNGCLDSDPPGAAGGSGRVIIKYSGRPIATGGAVSYINDTNANALKDILNNEEIQFFNGPSLNIQTGSIKFDGVDDSLFSNRAIINDRNFSIILWVKRNQPNNSGSFFSCSRGPGTRDLVNFGYRNSSDDLRFYYYNWSGNDESIQAPSVTLNTSQNTNDYTMVSVTCENQTFSLFVNGKQRSQTNIVMPSDISGIKLGRSSGAGSNAWGNWNGEIGQCWFYSKKLDNNEIEKIFTATRSRYGI